MSQIINVAFCGAGGIVRGNHLPSLKARADRYTVVGLYDIDPARSAALAGSKYKAYGTYAELLADDQVDLVVVATKPLTTHYPAVKQALEAGKHVVVEKPMAHSAEACDELIDLAKAKGLILTIHHNRRLDLDFLALLDILGKGKLGQVKMVEDRIGSGGYAGGDFEDWGIHLIDQMLLINETPLKEVSAFMANPEGGTLNGGFCEATLRFEKPPITRISALPRTEQFLANGTPAPYRFYAIGSEGAFTQRTIEHPNDLMNATQNFAKVRPDYAVPSYLKVERREYYDYLYESLVNGAELLVKPEQARNAIRVLELIAESAMKEATIPATNMRQVP